MNTVENKDFDVLDEKELESTILKFIEAEPTVRIGNIVFNTKGQVVFTVKDGKKTLVKEVFDSDTLDFPRLPGEKPEEYKTRTDQLVYDMSRLSGAEFAGAFDSLGAGGKIPGKYYPGVRLPNEEATVFLARFSKVKEGIFFESPKVPSKRMKFVTSPTEYLLEEKSLNRMLGIGIVQDFNPFGQKHVWNKPA